MFTRVPARWLTCPRKGELIGLERHRFMPFKTLLDERYNDDVPETNRWNIDMLFDAVESRGARLGMVIDLTNTERFYRKGEIERRDCKYVKLRCQGHDEAPSPEQTEAFINLCSNFFHLQPKEVIGVHCTHGFNRTGFLICAYLVEKLSMSIEDAVEIFSNSRPPGIYKKDYIDELFKRFGYPEDAPEVPELPDWCFDDQRTEMKPSHLQNTEHNKKSHNSGGNTSTLSRPPSRPTNRPPKIESKTEFAVPNLAGVKKIISDGRLDSLKRKCATWCKWKDPNTFPGGQPVTLDVRNLNLLAEKPYKVSWKADGTRYLLLIDGRCETYFIDRDNTYYHAPDFFFPDRKDPVRNLIDTLADGELVVDQYDGKQIINFLIYDIISFKGKDVCNTIFSIRMQCIEREIHEPRKSLDKSREPFQIRVKHFWDVRQASILFEKKFSEQLTHEIDGLIFQPSKDPYLAGSNRNQLKWKPPELNTVDFKLRIQKLHPREGQLPETKALLFVGGLMEPFAEMKLTKQLREYDGRVIECRYDFKLQSWELLRLRTDKSIPNHITTASSVCDSLRDPVTKDRLLKFIKENAFQPPESTKPPLKRPHESGSNTSLMPPPSSIPSPTKKTCPGPL